MHLCSPPLLQQPGVEAEATGQIQDALPGERPHHAEDGVTLGPFQGRRPRVSSYLLPMWSYCAVCAMQCFSLVLL